MKRCDIHVHSLGSDAPIGIHFTKMCDVRECYSTPEEIYNAATARGMDYVTITDHNKLDRSVYLVEHIDRKKCFTGCEYTVNYPETGHKLEVICLNLTEKHHKELLILRKAGLKDFAAYIKENKIPHTLAHPAWPVELKPKLNQDTILEWMGIFNVIETINADLERANDIAKRLVKAKGYKAIDETGMRILGTTGGSDAHILSGIARAYTVAPNAKSKEGFLEAILQGEVYAEGEYSSLELFHSQIQEGINAFVRHEYQNIKKYGLIEYTKKNPTKSAYIALVPILRHVIPAAIARNLKTKLEEQAYSLEKKCVEAILSREFKEEMMEIFQRVYARKHELEDDIKAPGYYLPPLSGIWATFIEKIRERWDLVNADYNTTND